MRFFVRSLSLAALVLVTTATGALEAQATHSSETASSRRASSRTLPAPYTRGFCIQGWCRDTSCGLEERGGPLTCRQTIKIGEKQKRCVVCVGEEPCSEYDIEFTKDGKRRLVNIRDHETPRKCARACRRFLRENPQLRPGRDYERR